MALTALRTKLFLHLAANGCDFIHNDADAFWLRATRAGGSCATRVTSDSGSRDGTSRS